MTKTVFIDCPKCGFETALVNTIYCLGCGVACPTSFVIQDPEIYAARRLEGYLAAKDLWLSKKNESLKKS